MRALLPRAALALAVSLALAEARALETLPPLVAAAKSGNQAAALALVSQRAGIDEAAADVSALLRDGRRVHLFVEHAIGSLQRPMSDAALEAKFAAQSEPVLGAAATAGLIAACRRIGALSDVREMLALARPPAR